MMTLDQYHKKLHEKYCSDKTQILPWETTSHNAQITGFNITKKGILDKKKAIVYIQGLGSPAETSFFLGSELAKELDYSFYVYDQAGYPLSDRKNPSQQTWLNDMNRIGTKLKDTNKLEEIVLIGHSLGGLNSLLANNLENFPYSQTIALAPPHNPRQEILKRVGGLSKFLINNLPQRVSNKILGKALYKRNQQRANDYSIFRDEIARHHLPFIDPDTNELDKSKCLGRPSYFTMSCPNPYEDFWKLLIDFPDITEIDLKNPNREMSIIYAGRDSHLGFVDNNAPPENEVFDRQFRGRAYPIGDGVYERDLIILPDYNHTFNPSTQNETWDSPIHMIGYDRSRRDNRLVETICNMLS